MQASSHLPATREQGCGGLPDQMQQQPGDTAATAVVTPVGVLTCPVLFQVVPALACSSGGPTDQQVVGNLAASDKVYRRLLRAASRAQLLLCGRSGWMAGAVPASANGSPALLVELYGSLALTRDYWPQSSSAGSVPDRHTEAWSTEPGGCAGKRQWEWPTHYARPSSDADLVVLLQEGVEPQAVVRRLLDRGCLELIAQTSVPKFATTHFSLRGTAGGSTGDKKGRAGGFTQVGLDLTCISSRLEYERFQCRQEAFRQNFAQARSVLQERFGGEGAHAFDAYIFLVKAFSAKVPCNALSAFQAVCLGVFCIQLRLYELSGSFAPSGAVLLECFLRFLTTFFSDTCPSESEKLRSYRCCAIDLSLGGRLLPRMSHKWKCEVYDMFVEVRLQTTLEERLNIARSLAPKVICCAAKKALASTCYVGHGECWWR